MSRQSGKGSRLPLRDKNMEELAACTKILGHYDILSNDADEIMIVVPFQLIGDGWDAVFYYDGGAHGILVKNPLASAVCDQINPGVRKLLSTRSEVLFYERDEEGQYEQEYKAPLVLCEDVEAFAEKLVKAVKNSQDDTEGCSGANRAMETAEEAEELERDPGDPDDWDAEEEDEEDSSEEDLDSDGTEDEETDDEEIDEETERFFSEKKTRPKNIGKALEAIESLVGMEEFKAYIRELEAMRPQLVQWKDSWHFPSQHLLFAIDSGNGCSILLKCLHEYLRCSDLHFPYDTLFGSEYDFAELTYQYSSHVSVDSDAVAEEINSMIGENTPGLIGIHIEDWLDKLHTEQFNDFLRYCGMTRYKNTFVFLVPCLDEGVLSRVHKRLNDVLNVRLIRFTPYSDADYIRIAAKETAAHGLQWDPSVDKYFKYAIRLEKSDRRFYGIKTAMKLAEEMLLVKMRNVALKSNSCAKNILMGEDFREYAERNGISEGISGFEQLEALVGMKNVKQRIREIVVSLQAQRAVEETGHSEGKPCYHMMFTGNPGTGKTEVARIVGRIFLENGLLSDGDLHEVSRFDLVGEYIGQTGPKTIAVCRSALGSVLFLDEAYLLASASGGSDNRDYGPEAVGALIAEMENNRDQFVVIMAGYREEMEKLCEVNSGLSARIPHRIHFENYSREELFEIFRKQLEGQYDVEEALLSKAGEFFAALPEETVAARDFGNARFVRNLTERIRIKAFIRLYGVPLNKRKRIQLTVTDFENAVSDTDLAALHTKSKPYHIGFL